jgi:hypothetical protein
MVLPLILGLPNMVAAFAKTQYPNGIVSSISFVHHEHGKELGRPRLSGIGADAEASVLRKESYPALDPSSHSAGTTAGAALSLIKTTRNFAG